MNKLLGRDLALGCIFAAISEERCDTIGLTKETPCSDISYRLLFLVVGEVDSLCKEEAAAPICCR